MKTKIRSVLIVNQQGSCSYYVGSKYNNLLLDNIRDHSVEFENSLTVIYQGYTKDAALVFETINAPVVVEYEACP